MEHKKQEGEAKKVGKGAQRVGGVGGQEGRVGEMGKWRKWGNGGGCFFWGWFIGVWRLVQGGLFLDVCLFLDSIRSIFNLISTNTL